MHIAKRLALILVMLIGCVGCDQTTKSVAQSYLPSAESWSFLGDTVRLQLTYNPGAFLSVGASLPTFWRYAVFSVGGGVLLLGLLGYALFSKRLTPVGVVAIALYLAGGVSNLADRWAYGGYVVDFINLGIGPVRTGIFNIADVFVTAGAVVLFVSEFHRTKFLTLCSRRTR
ncbi:MAG: signal peptidase II [Gammaproteobacteria bacterium]